MLMEVKQSTGALLREVARLHVQLQRTCVAYCGGTTTTQCTVLTELGRSGPVTLAELSRRIGFDKSWTSRAVENLVQEGLVEKVVNRQDRRSIASCPACVIASEKGPCNSCSSVMPSRKTASLLR